MKLTESQKKYLRGLGHKLKPVVTVGGAGLSEAVLREVESAIAHHELIKVRVRAADRAARDEAFEAMCAAAGATLVARIGNVGLMFRPDSDDPSIRLPR